MIINLLTIFAVITIVIQKWTRNQGTSLP